MSYIIRKEAADWRSVLRPGVQVECRYNASRRGQVAAIYTEKDLLWVEWTDGKREQYHPTAVVVI